MKDFNPYTLDTLLKTDWILLERLKSNPIQLFPPDKRIFSILELVIKLEDLFALSIAKSWPL